MGLKVTMRDAVLALAGIVLCACSAPPERVRVNDRGVVHVSATGQILDTYDPEHSFFPIGLYHALSGMWSGETFDLAAIRQARFNTVHLWEGQDQEKAARTAAAAGLHSIVHYPLDWQVVALQDEPLVLGWYLDEEPSHLLEAEASQEALTAFRVRRAAIRKLDSTRPVFAIDGPHAAKVGRVWRQWAEAGDVSAHFNYPVTVKKLRSATPPQRVAETVSLARALVTSNEGPDKCPGKCPGKRPGKPLWFVVQAFGGHDRGWRMPHPDEYRAMVYSAVIQGASGIIVFAYDSFVMRDDGIVGVRPHPQAAYAHDVDYNGDGKPPHVADADELAASRRLWDEVVAINDELETLAPWLLSSTDSALPLQVMALAGWGEDVNFVIKNKGGQRVLIVQNTGTGEVALRLTSPGVVSTMAPFFNHGEPRVREDGPDAWRLRLKAYQVSVLRLELVEGASW